MKSQDLWDAVRWGAICIHLNTGSDSVRKGMALVTDPVLCMQMVPVQSPASPAKGCQLQVLRKTFVLRPRRAIVSQIRPQWTSSLS